MSEAYILCTQCRAVMTEEECDAKPGACPHCGNKGLPADIRKKSTLTFTHAEWRVLFIWAGRWASEKAAPDDKPGYDSNATIAAMIREAKRQSPELPSLSLLGDVQEAVNVIGSKAEIHGGPDGTIIVEPEKKH